MRDWQNELDSYIKKMFALGYSKREIKDALSGVGWTDDLIVRGMRRIEKAGEPFLLLEESDQKKHAQEFLLPAPPPRDAMLLIGAASWTTRIGIRKKSFLKAVWLTIAFFTEKIFDSAEIIYAALLRAVLFPLVLFSIAGKGLWHMASKARARKEKGAQENNIAVKEAHSAQAIQKFPEHVLARDIVKLAGRMFRARRLRTFLTILGMSVGIGTILFLVSFGYGIQNVLFERITTEEALLALDAFPPSDNALIMADDALVEKIKSMAHVKEVSMLALLSSEMALDNFTAAGALYAVDAGYLKLSGLRPLAGTLLQNKSEYETVISSATLKLLNFNDPKEALGKELKFSVSLPLDKESGETEVFELEHSYVIAGVLDDPFSVFAYLPFGALAGRAQLSYAQLKIKVDMPESLNEVRDQVLAQGLLVSALSETVSQAKKIFNIITIILGLFGIITLVVSAIGMLNTMTIALLERTQEVGIMKAVGASNLDIWKLFLAEAMIMGFLGGVGGIIMGFVTAQAFNYGINVLAEAFGGQSLNLFQSPVWFVLTIIVFSSAVGVVTGLWPARRASKLDPLEALKYK
ncbi:hypothetical protein A2988_01350 [Candidatus Azambacteria bacterium RIFCSPLOWO2_01_FULL_46_25]|uniref:ABC3 transporter permease protein domain-containing protein n=1 Tax=Candidatus Azambacteria bacterium RIFCSPLOWO2_01_FULL_46_25 TaxID=1797298 RepID=A0A1F5BU25_9BACT|nr:MAG: hypothetical protein A2988_01350 [Candidatus Azambacteria bacterium RIFCSPLOWO2_01_FULL_46_25]OGD36709.1 MAG: hypothetical protein A2850_00305 [Candidatus Azambacteria bacterium RIFCSPHIGHO2_01_FULL_51_74]